ncbi:MAG: hypothetical protein ACFFDP_03920 [Promethearchaeota archaeon]
MSMLGGGTETRLLLRLVIPGYMAVLIALWVFPEILGLYPPDLGVSVLIAVILAFAGPLVGFILFYGIYDLSHRLSGARLLNRWFPTKYQYSKKRLHYQRVAEIIDLVTSQAATLIQSLPDHSSSKNRMLHFTQMLQTKTQSGALKEPLSKDAPLHLYDKIQVGWVSRDKVFYDTFIWENYPEVWRQIILYASERHCMAILFGIFFVFTPIFLFRLLAFLLFPLLPFPTDGASIIGSFYMLFWTLISSIRIPNYEAIYWVYWPMVLMMLVITWAFYKQWKRMSSRLDEYEYMLALKASRQFERECWRMIATEFLEAAETELIKAPPNSQIRLLLQKANKSMVDGFFQCAFEETLQALKLGTKKSNLT